MTDPSEAAAAGQLPPRRRGLFLTAALVAVGAGIILLSATQPAFDLPRATLPAETIGQEAPALPAMGVVALAGAGALLAVAGWLRLLVGALLLASATTVLVAAADRTTQGRGQLGLPPAESSVWWWICDTGAALVAIGGLLAVLLGYRWPGLGARYQRTSEAARGQARSARQRTPASLWDDLDRGEDPTA